MNSSTFADFSRNLDANPRFYDRCIAVCSFLMLVALAGVIFLKVNDRPTIELRSMAPIVSPAAAPADEVAIQPRGNAAT